jgi:hypothetical protein
MIAKREHLNEYTRQHEEIMNAGAAIEILERMRDPAAQRCITQLLAAQQRALKRMDKAAALLGAPYPPAA